MKQPDIPVIESSSIGTNFDMSPYTNSTLRLDMSIDFQGVTPMKVFDVMGDPQRMKDWYLLVKEIQMHPPNINGEIDFDVDFMLFGRVHEEILYWNKPYQYVYKAFGDEFPIKDYIALIEIQEIGPQKGVMLWRQYFNEIEGVNNQNLLSVILPAINEASLKRLAPLIGGTAITMQSHF